MARHPEMHINGKNKIDDMVSIKEVIEVALGGTSSLERCRKKTPGVKKDKRKKKRHGVITLLWQLRCEYNTGHSNVFYLIQRGDRFSIALLTATYSIIVNSQNRAVLLLRKPVEPP